MINDDAEIQIVSALEPGPQGPQGIQGPPGTTDHGALTGLTDDDHLQYLNTERGDARYYTETETAAFLANKSDVGHTHTIGQVDGLTDALAGKQPAGSYAASSHTHTASQITDFSDAVAAVAYTKTQSDLNLSTAINGVLAAAPGQLDTLNELAAALGNDANFATTVTASLATKLDASKVQSKVWIPSDMTGATDVTGELEAFVIANPGFMVKLPDNAVILLKNAFKTLADAAVPDILIDFGKATILYNNNTSVDAAIYADNTSNASANRPVTALAMATVNNDATVSQLTIATTLGVKRFDWLALYSDNVNPAKAGGFLGEIFQAFSDENTLNILATRKLNRHDFYTSNVQVRKLDRTRRLHIRGGKFKANGNPEARNITQRCKAIVVQGWVDPFIENVLFDAPWAQCVQFVCCAAPRMVNIEVRNVGNMAAFNGYIYGGQLYGMNDCADIRNMVIRNGRHAGFTTDGNSNNTPTWHQRGIPTNFVVSEIHGYNCNASVVDTHEEGDGGTISNVTNYYPYQDEDIAPSFSGITAQLRCSNTTLTNVRQYGGTGCIKVNAIDHGFEDTIHLNDIHVKNTTQGASLDSDIAISIIDQSTIVNKRRVFIDNCTLNNVGTAISVGKTAKVNVGNVRATGCKIFMDNNLGSETILHGNVFMDFRGSTRGAPYFCHQVRSGAYTDPGTGLTSNVGSSVIYLNKPKLLKGNADNKPQYFFEEHDTTAPKTVYAEGLIEWNPSNVVPTQLYKAGATSFVSPNITNPVNRGMRIITVAGDVTVLDSDDLIGFNKDVSASTIATLPTAGIKGRRYGFVDLKKDAQTKPITIKVGATTLLTINGNGGFAEFQDTGTAWALVNFYAGVVAAVVLTVAPFDIVMNGRVDATTTISAAQMIAPANFFPANSKRGLTRYDLTGYTKVKLVSNVASTGPAAGKLTLVYKPATGTGAFSYSASAATDMLPIGTSEVGGSIAVAGIVDSGWIDLAPGAQGDVVIGVLQSGGDGTVAAGLGVVHAFFK